LFLKNKNWSLGPAIFELFNFNYRLIKTAGPLNQYKKEIKPKILTQLTQTNPIHTNLSLKNRKINVKIRISYNIWKTYGCEGFKIFEHKNLKIRSLKRNVPFSCYSNKMVHFYF